MRTRVALAAALCALTATAACGSPHEEVTEVINEVMTDLGAAYGVYNAAYAEMAGEFDAMSTCAFEPESGWTELSAGLRVTNRQLWRDVSDKRNRCLLTRVPASRALVGASRRLGNDETNARLLMRIRALLERAAEQMSESRLATLLDSADGDRSAVVERLAAESAELGAVIAGNRFTTDLETAAEQAAAAGEPFEQRMAAYREAAAAFTEAHAEARAFAETAAEGP